MFNIDIVSSCFQFLQGYGNRSITLYDIRAELNSRYKDLRSPFHPPSPEEAFSMLTRETPETFYRGRVPSTLHQFQYMGL